MADDEKAAHGDEAESGRTRQAAERQKQPANQVGAADGEPARGEDAGAAGHDVPDREWVDTADLHTGDEDGMPEHAEEQLEHTEDRQSEIEHGIGDEQIASMEDIEARKREVAEEAVKPLQSTDYEVGAEEVPYLRGGVTADQALKAYEDNAQRMQHGHQRMAARDSDAAE